MGTHFFWTVALSVAITLLALSPLVLPGGHPLQHLPPPLSAIESVGRIVTSEVAAPVLERIRNGGEDADGPEGDAPAEALAPAPPAGDVLSGIGDGAGAEPPAPPDTVPPPAPGPKDSKGGEGPDREPDDVGCRRDCGGGIDEPREPEAPEVQQPRGNAKAWGHVKAWGKGHWKNGNGQGHEKHHDDDGGSVGAKPAPPGPPSKGGGGGAKSKGKPDNPGKSGGKSDHPGKGGGKPHDPGNSGGKTEGKDKSKGGGKGKG